MMKCFCYLRVSGRSQVRGDGFLRQFLACRQWASANGLQIVRVFKERGVSGTKELDDRPQLSALFAALEADGVRHILVEKLDRLARDLLIQETIVADMLKKGYVLVSAMEPDLCSTDPSRILVRQVFGAIAQYEKAMLVLKLRGARDRQRARGIKCDGRKAFGEKDGEAPILQKIRDLRSQGKDSGAIAFILNVSGNLSRYGKPWRPGTISKILSRDRKAA
jgi:DNA invertase Pin-like site-specific DNA recombinase